MHPKIKIARSRFAEFRERTREAGLTALLVIQVVLIFIAAPLIGMGVLPQILMPIAFAVFVLAILVVTSRSYAVSALVLIAVVLSPAGAFVRADYLSPFTECLSAAGRMLALAALSLVIARAVFGAGRVTMHRVQGAIVLYLNFALFFFVLYRLLEVLLPNPFVGLPPAGSEHGFGRGAPVFQLHHFNHRGLRRYHAAAPARPRSCQSRIGDRSALSGNAAGAAGQSRNRASARAKKAKRRLNTVTAVRRRQRVRRGCFPCRAPTHWSARQ